MNIPAGSLSAGTQYVLEGYVTLDPALVQFFYAQKATQKGSPRNKETVEDREGLGSSQRRKETIVTKLRRTMDLRLLHSTDLQMGRVCDSSCSACRPKTRPKTRKK